MDSLSELIGKITLNNFDVGSSSWVDVTHINNPHSFYVRPTAYRSFLPLLQSHDEQIDRADVMIQATVIFKSATKDGNYVRGKILFMEESEDQIKCDILATDYGFIEKSVTLLNIWKPKYDVDIPITVLHCQLADCKPLDDVWTEKTTEAMAYYVKDERAKMEVRGKIADKLLVQLVNSCPDDIATLLALTGHSTLGYGENVISRQTVPTAEKCFYTYKVLNVDDVLHVRVQSGTSVDNFYVAEINDYKRYLNERNNVTYFSKKQRSLNTDDLKIDTLVNVYHHTNGYYERGLIKKVTVPNSKAVVQLMDWGSTVEIHISKMKEMTKKMLTFPVTAIWCSADESETWNNGLHKFLYPGFEFYITVKKIGDGNSPNVVKISPRS